MTEHDIAIMALADAENWDGICSYIRRNCSARHLYVSGAELKPITGGCDLALHKALEAKTRAGTCAALELLKTNLTNFLSYTTDKKETALHAAARTGNYEVTEAILQLAAHTHYRQYACIQIRTGRDEPTPFAVASEAGQWAILQLFLKTCPSAIEVDRSPRHGANFGSILVRAAAAKTPEAARLIDAYLEIQSTPADFDLTPQFSKLSDAQQSAIVETWGTPESAASRFIQESIASMSDAFARTLHEYHSNHEHTKALFSAFLARKIPATPDTLKKFFDPTDSKANIALLYTVFADESNKITTPFLAPWIEKFATLICKADERLKTAKNLITLGQLKQDIGVLHLVGTLLKANSPLTRLPRLPVAFAILATDSIAVFHRKLSDLNKIAETYAQALRNYNASDKLVISGHPLADALEAQRRSILTRIKDDLDAFDPEERLNEAAKQIAQLHLLDERIKTLCSIAGPRLGAPSATGPTLENLENTVVELERLNTAFLSKRTTVQVLLTERIGHRFPGNDKLNASLAAIAIRRARLLEKLPTRLQNANLDKLAEIEAELTVLKDFDAALTAATPELNYALALHEEDALNPELIARWKMLDLMFKAAKEELTQLGKPIRLYDYAVDDDHSPILPCITARHFNSTVLHNGLKLAQDNASYLRLCIQIEDLKIRDAQIYIIAQDKALGFYTKTINTPAKQAIDEIIKNYISFFTDTKSNPDYFNTFIDLYINRKLSYLQYKFTAHTSLEQAAIVSSWGQAGDNAANSFIAKVIQEIAHSPSIIDGMPVDFELIVHYLEEKIKATPENLAIFLGIPEARAEFRKFNAEEFSAYFLPYSIKNLRKRVLAKIGAEIETATSIAAVAKLKDDLIKLKAIDAKLKSLFSLEPYEMRLYLEIEDEKNSVEELKNIVDEVESSFKSFLAKKAEVQKLFAERKHLYGSRPLPVNDNLKETLRFIKSTRARLLLDLDASIPEVSISMCNSLTQLIEIEKKLSALKVFDEKLALELPRLKYDLNLGTDVRGQDLNLDGSLVDRLVAHDRKGKELHPDLESARFKKFNTQRCALLSPKDKDMPSFAFKDIIDLTLRARYNAITELLVTLLHPQDETVFTKLGIAIANLTSLDQDLSRIINREAERTGTVTPLASEALYELKAGYSQVQSKTEISADQQVKRDAFKAHCAEYYTLIHKLNTLKAAKFKVPRETSALRDAAIDKLFRDVHHFADAEKYAFLRTQIEALEATDADLRLVLNYIPSKAIKNVTPALISNALKDLDKAYKHLSEERVVEPSMIRTALIADLKPSPSPLIKVGLLGGGLQARARAGAGAAVEDDKEATEAIEDVKGAALLLQLQRLALQADADVAGAACAGAGAGAGR